MKHEPMTLSALLLAAAWFAVGCALTNLLWVLFG